MKADFLFELGTEELPSSAVEKLGNLLLQNLCEEFKKLNITRDLIKTDKLENWSYNKLDESKRIAGIIKKRIIEGINESK